jgi:hypothetical protein
MSMSSMGQAYTSPEQHRMTAELVALLRQRVASQYYDQPQVLEVIARAILHSRGVYPQ